MTKADVDLAVAAYAALLQAGLSADAEIAELLQADGIDVRTLLLADGTGAEIITRADLCELVLAASLIGVDGGRPERLFMPNVPKMSRRKSDSGVDIFEARIDPSYSGDLDASESLHLSSVKHSISSSTYDVRSKLQNSLSEKELHTIYMTEQLRVLNGRLQEQGLSADLADRVFLFLRGFPDPKTVRMLAGAVVDATAEVDLLAELARLPDLKGRKAHFRAVLFPGLKSVHARCP